MAEAVSQDFDVWLKNTLIKLDTDDEIFRPYITGILEGDDTNDEKRDALQGILSEITESGIDQLCKDIFTKWTIHEDKESAPAPVEQTIDVDSKLAKLMESQTHMVVTTKKTNTEQAMLKKAILAQYGEVSDGELDEDEGLKPNNADEVVKAEKEKRERDKEESQRKKDKDKDDRSKQKTKEEDRKEKEKKRTQKGEKRR